MDLVRRRMGVDLPSERVNLDEAMDALKRAVKMAEERMEIRNAAELFRSVVGSSDAPNPLDGLKELGFDIKGISAAQHEIAEGYRKMAERNAKARQATEEEVRKVRDELGEAKLQLLGQQLGSQIADLKNALVSTQGKGPRDQQSPVVGALEKAAAKIVERSLSGDGEQKPRSLKDSIQEVVEVSELLTKLAAGGRSSGEADHIVALASKNLEAARLLAEIRLKERDMAERRELEERRGQRLEQTVGFLGGMLEDLFGALGETLRGDGSQPATPEQAGPSAEVSSGPYEYTCPNCGGVFVLAKRVEDPTCPYCHTQLTAGDGDASPAA